ncbi:MAG: efflux RND transporter periplasmic adaptor subunit [Chloroflexota bacterium]
MRLKFKMSAFLSKIKKPAILSRLSKRAIWVLAAAVVLMGGGGFAYYRMVYLPGQVSEVSTLQTAVVQQGDLVIYASGTGTLIAADEVDLAFTTAGQVTEILCEVSDQVKAGDLLATVDDTDAQVSYIQAKRNLADLISPAAIASAQQAIAQAEADLGDANSSLGYLISPSVLRWEGEVQEAEEALAEAQTALNASPGDEDAQKALEEAQAYLKRANANLKSAQSYYENEYLPDNFTRWDGRTGKKYIARPSEADILGARATVAAAEAALQEAQYLYTALTGGEVPEDATGSGLTEFENAQLELDAAQTKLEGTQLIAPISGTVMSIDIGVGDSVGESGSAITLADLTHPVLEVFLDESDWSNVGVGYEAEIVFDILPEKTFTGTVTQVDPGLYSEGNTSVVRTLVKLDETEASFNFPLGTSASVDVIGGRAENAVLVPIEALHKAGEQYTVFVMENGAPRLRVIEIGIQDLLYAEVKSGLNAGDVVTTGITETQ